MSFLRDALNSEKAEKDARWRFLRTMELEVGGRAGYAPTLDDRGDTVGLIHNRARKAKEMAR